MAGSTKASMADNPTILTLTDGVEITLLPDAQLPGQPALDAEFMSIRLTPFVTAEEYAQFKQTHFRNDAGGGSALDVFYFHQETKALGGVFLHTTSSGLAEADYIGEWMAQPATVGLPILASEPPISIQPQIDASYYSRLSDCLICLDQTRGSNFNVPTKLAIAQDTYLLFEDGLLAGWLLHKPWRYIIRNINYHTKLAKEIFAQYFLLTSGPMMQKIMMGDPATRAAVQMYYQMLRETDRVDVGHLVTEIETLLDFWYD